MRFHSTVYGVPEREVNTIINYPEPEIISHPDNIIIIVTFRTEVPLLYIFIQCNYLFV